MAINPPRTNHQDITPAMIADALAGLGGTPDAAPAAMRAAGVTGHPSSACHCPLSRWLRLRLRLYGHATVMYTSIRIGPASVETPGHLLEFVCRFDRGDYPDLLAAVGRGRHEECP